MQSSEWSARRILKELCGADRRLEILTTFWLHGDDMSRRIAVSQLAKSMRFREASVRKMPAPKKAQLLVSRVGSAEFEEFFEAALLAFHLRERKELMGSCLDAWEIPHVDGAIEVDDYEVPTRERVDETLVSLGERFDRADLLLYLATAGLVMGDAGSEWRNSTWPVVDAATRAEAGSEPT